LLPGRRKLAAIVAGAVLAGAPVLFAHYLLDRHIERQAQQEVELTAKRGMWLAESRISRAIAALTELAKGAVHGCDPRHLQALNAMALNVAPIKELAVVGLTGETLCTNTGLPTGRRETLSRDVLGFAANILIEVVRVPGSSEHFVRIRRMDPEGTNGLAALIPAEAFLPQVSNHGGPLRVHTIMTTRNGTLIGERGTSAPHREAPQDRIAVAFPSENFGLHLTASMSRASLAATQRDLRGFAVLAGATLAMLLFALALLACWRESDNPIAALRRALDEGEFVPYYQPILDITNGRLEGAEVLIRWRRPDGTIVPPGAFIPLLESSGLIFEVTRNLMERVCREAGAAIGRRPRLRISFNLTARHFAEQSTVPEIRAIFSGAPIALSQLVLEVTEREPLGDLATARAIIAGLQELGARVAIDDVGAGHGGLSYLLKLGVDIIKIDKLFVDAIGAERHSAAIIDSLVELSRNMRMDIVAEGVENFEQVAYLRDHGIRLAQGYVFAPPLPGTSFLQLLEAADPVPAEAEGGPAAVARYISARNRAALA
jgi:sensor c-di-GMP phosphodiesterase-like protein